MLEIKDLSKSYGKKRILKSVNFSAQNNSCVGIIGKNGSGKSTLLSILAGLLQADSGECLWENENFLHDKNLRKKISGYVPQNFLLFDELSAFDNLQLWHSGNKKELENLLETGSLKFLGVHEFLFQKVSKLSGGMKKRLSIACAVINNPQLLFLDEPSSSLDILCRAQIREYLNAFRNEGGTIIIVTHDTEEILLCDKCFLLSDGILSPYTYSGNPSDIEKDLAKI